MYYKIKWFWPSIPGILSCFNYLLNPPLKSTIEEILNEIYN